MAIVVLLEDVELKKNIFLNFFLRLDHSVFCISDCRIFGILFIISVYHFGIVLQFFLFV